MPMWQPFAIMRGSTARDTLRNRQAIARPDEKTPIQTILLLTDDVDATTMAVAALDDLAPHVAGGR